MSSLALGELEDHEAAAIRALSDGIPPTTAAYQQRRDHLLAQAGRGDLHAELLRRYREQLLMLDVTGQQWQALVLSTTERLERMALVQQALLEAAPQRAKAALQHRGKAAGDNADAFDRLLAAAARAHLEVAQASVWLAPWSRAAAASALLAVQDAYRTVLEASDTRAAKAAAVALGKKAVDFIPVFGPILTGGADAYEAADTPEAASRAASDELTRLDEYLFALRRIALAFEAVLAASEADAAGAAPTAEALVARVNTRRSQLAPH